MFRRGVHGDRAVAVIGGGIGGLSAAAFLRRAGLPVRIYEQAGELTEVGAGLILAPNAIRLLRRLGLSDRLAEVAVPLEVGWEFRRWQDGRVLFAQTLGAECVRRYGEHTWTLHRADLVDLLRSVLPADDIRLGMRCTGVDTGEDEVTVRFADDAPVSAAVAVAADGIHSVLRGQVSTPALPRHSGTCAFRCLVPAEAAPELARRPVQTLWLGPGRHLVHYPVSGGRQINIVAIVPAAEDDIESWTSEGRPEDLVAAFAGWDARLGELLAAATRVGRWAMLDREPIMNWVSGRLALLGDAAHPMLPFFAQGAGQAIEDAAALAACLAEDEPVAEALRRYQRIRAPRAARVQKLSHGRLDHNHLPDGAEQRARDAALGTLDPLRHNDWLYSYDAEEVAGVG